MKIVTGPPHTNQKVVLTSARFRRSRAVPPPGNVRLAMLTPIQAATASTASAMIISRQITPGANSQARNHVVVYSFLRSRESKTGFHSPRRQRYQDRLR